MFFHGSLFFSQSFKFFIALKGFSFFRYFVLNSKFLLLRIFCVVRSRSVYWEIWTLAREVEAKQLLMPMAVSRNLSQVFLMFHFFFLNLLKNFIFLLNRYRCIMRPPSICCCGILFVGQKKVIMFCSFYTIFWTNDRLKILNCHHKLWTQKSRYRELAKRIM